MIGQIIVSQGKVVRPSQLIASVGHTLAEGTGALAGVRWGYRMATRVVSATLLASILSCLATQASAQSVALPKSATKLEIVVFQDSWVLQGRTGKRYRADLPNANQTLWYTFTMPKDGVIYLQNFSTEENYSTLDLFDSSGKDPDPASWMDSAPRRVFNGRIRKGQYYLRITCPKGCKAAVVTELARFEE